MKLKQACTIRDFPEATEDRVVADSIRDAQLDAAVEAGGATAHSNVGVMALRPTNVQIAHLGFPADQPGGHVDFSLVDQYTLDPDGVQGVHAQERFGFLPFYQPNAAFPCKAVPNPTVQAARSTRSDWGLPEGKFVFALFCRLGRVDTEQISSLASMLIRSSDSVLWLRASPKFALVRMLSVFREKKIARSRIVLAIDVPTEVHQERLRHADLGLDTRMYGAHTTCSDFAQHGVPVIALEGKWWHTRVASGLMFHLLGNDELVAKDLVEFENKAVFFSKGEGRTKLLTVIRPAIMAAIQRPSGIFDGRTWISAFERIISEAIRQKRAGETFKDIYSVPRRKPTPTDSGRESVFVLEPSSQTMSTASLGLQETLSNSKKATAVSSSMDDAAITQAANEEYARKEEVGQAMGPEGVEQTSKRPDRSK